MRIKKHKINFDPNYYTEHESDSSVREIKKDSLEESLQLLFPPKYPFFDFMNEEIIYCFDDFYIDTPNLFLIPPRSDLHFEGLDEDQSIMKVMINKRD
jgi:hypothetical protein